MRQRILFLEQQSWRSGAQRVLDEALHALGKEFLPLVAFPEDGPFAADLRYRNIETLVFPLGRYRSGAKSLTDMLALPPRSLLCSLRLAQIIRRRQIHLVYINSPRCLLAGVLAARLTHTPSLFHLHMTITRCADLWMATWAARRVTKIIACSKTAASALLESEPQLADVLEVVYNPVCKPAADQAASNVPPAAFLASSGVPVVGLVGRITRQKGHHVLLKAAARLARHGQDVQVACVGAPGPNSAEDESYLRFLKSSARELGLDGRIHWLGYQEDPNVFYAIFDVLVIPSTVSEGLPMVALEALQWGVPVIGSEIGGIPEVICNGVNGLLAPPEDEEALADCLERVLGNSELRARLRAGALSSIGDRFSADNFRREIRRILFELCAASC